MTESVIPILRVGSAADAVRWYQRLGFQQEWEHRFEPELPAFVSIARGDMRLYLSEHTGDARPDTLIYLWVEDIQSLSKEFAAAITEQSWASEIALRDPDGNRLRIGQRKP